MSFPAYDFWLSCPERSFHQMDVFLAIVYYNDHMTITSEGVLFQCPHGPTFLKVTKDKMVTALKKKIHDAVESSRKILNIHYRQPISLGNGCVHYGFMEIKHNKDVARMLSMFAQFPNLHRLSYR